MACSSCKRLKRKCDRAELPAGAPCTRCRQRGSPCSDGDNVAADLGVRAHRVVGGGSPMRSRGHKSHAAPASAPNSKPFNIIWPRVVDLPLSAAVVPGSPALSAGSTSASSSSSPVMSAASPSLSPAPSPTLSLGSSDIVFPQQVILLPVAPLSEADIYSISLMTGNAGVVAPSAFSSFRGFPHAASISLSSISSVSSVAGSVSLPDEDHDPFFGYASDYGNEPDVAQVDSFDLPASFANWSAWDDNDGLAPHMLL